MYRFSLGGDIITDDKDAIIDTLRDIADRMEDGAGRGYVACGLWGQEWLLDEDYEYPDDDEIEDPEDY